MNGGSKYSAEGDISIYNLYIELLGYVPSVDQSCVLDGLCTVRRINNGACRVRSLPYNS